MRKVALTGGIATGKSYCLGRFASLGIPVIDADRLARLAVAPGSAGLNAILERSRAAGSRPMLYEVRGSELAAQSGRDLANGQVEDEKAAGQLEEGGGGRVSNKKCSVAPSA